MTSIRKRGAVYGVIGLMLCVAVYLNWSYFQTPEDLLAADQALEDSGAVYGAVTAVDSEQDTGDAAGDTAGDKADDSVQQTDAVSDYFAQARLSRQNARDEALTMLKETVADENADDDAKQAASEQITAIAGDMVKEERAESQIKAKGYADCVVYIAEDAVSVVVAPPDGGMKAADAATISEIVTTETGAPLDTIRITEAK